MVVLVGARSLVRRAQPGDVADSARPRHLPAADSVQSSGARGGANRGARHHVERARRVRLGPVDNRAGTRRLPGESGRFARDVGRGGRRDPEDVDERDVQPRRQVFQDAGARGDSETDPETASADVGGGDAAFDLGNRGTERNRRARLRNFRAGDARQADRDLQESDQHLRAGRRIRQRSHGARRRYAYARRRAKKRK